MLLIRLPLPLGSPKLERLRLLKLPLLWTVSDFVFSVVHDYGPRETTHLVFSSPRQLCFALPDCHFGPPRSML